MSALRTWIAAIKIPNPVATLRVHTNAISNAGAGSAMTFALETVKVRKDNIVN